MLILPPFNTTNVQDSLETNPAIAWGTQATTGVSNADGTTVAVIGTALTFNAQYLRVGSHSNSASTVDSTGLMDIMIDRAGGTTWSSFIESIPIGFIDVVVAGAHPARWWDFPIWIPSGSTLGVRGRGPQATGRTWNTAFWLYGSPADAQWAGQQVDAIGAVRASSSGTAIAGGAANTFGSWVSVGAVTTRRYGAIHATIVPAPSGAITATRGHLEVGISSTRIGPTIGYQVSSAEIISNAQPTGLIWKDVPEGTQLQARIKTAVATQTHHVVLHGFA